MKEQLRILIVEDNQADVDLMTCILPVTGPVAFSVQSVPRLAAALARLADGGIDLVIADLGLPDSQGVATFRALRQTAPEVAIIVLTRQGDQEMALGVVREGAQDYLVKGRIGGDQLARAVRYAVARQKTENALRRNEATLQGILASSSDGILAVDDKAKVLYANRRFAEIWGLPAKNVAAGVEETVVYQALWSLTDPKSFLERVMALQHSDQESTETFLLTDGRTIVRSSTAMMLGGMVIGRVWSFRDITDHLLMESKVQAMSLGWAARPGMGFNADDKETP